MVLSVKGPAKLWLLIWVFSSWNQIGLAMLKPMMPTLAPIPQFASHSGQVCSTWGNYHFKTFTGDVYHFPGTCNYVFASHCKSSHEDFNIQIRRSVTNSGPVISHVTAMIDGVVVEILNKNITMDGVLITDLPVEKSRVHIDKIGNNVKIKASNDLVLMWNEEDSLLLELNQNKYANQTCGLCGDFSDVGGFTVDDIKLTPVQFGNLQKLNGPTEDCPDVTSSIPNKCTDKNEICKEILTSAAFSSCNTLVEPMHYIDACVEDLCQCSAENHILCLCNTFAEYSRQCSHSGGIPGNWRTSGLCPQSCPFNMVYQEHGSPCPNTCSNTERAMLCDEHGIDGCFCPPGTVLDDINNTGCVPQEECFCVYNSETYAPGSSYDNPCRVCKCTRGKWTCKELPCRGSCSVEGGAHITSFDGSRYSIHGDCIYVLAKHCSGDDFTLHGEMRRCRMTNSKSCLKNVVLSLKKGETVLAIQDTGRVFLNSIPIQLPLSVADITIYSPTSFYINIATRIGVKIQVQMVPVMQVYVTLNPSYHGNTCGLCGNFNNIQTDDFKAISGVIEATAAAFANTWKTLTNCPNIKNSYEDPCSLSLEKEKYAQHWCSLLTSPTGLFSLCHSLENPLPYYTNCLSDTCSCKDSEECMCAALSSYVYACAKKSVSLIGWRDTVCQKYTKVCKESQVYHYNVTQCQPTCRSLSEADVTFSFQFDPVDGCVCSDGTYVNDNGDCVVPSSCPCYYQGNVVKSGEIKQNGIACTCEKGQLNCMGVEKKPVCSHPLVYFDCTSAPKGTKGVECQRSCHTLDMDCYSSQCISGCVCPGGMVSDENGGCISEQQCPCFHNEATFSPGASISVDCNTCVCKNRKWQCTHKRCLGTCSIYGDGHYITFDNKQFTFSGSCEYTLAQDNCGQDGVQSSFRVITENVPCGTTGTTCSKNIKIFIGGDELRLDNEKIEVVKRDDKKTIQYEVFQRGMYLITDTENGIIIMWDKKTTIHIKLSPDFQAKVCGICGNYDGNANNDFTTRSQSVVENLMEFGNSWKTDPKCPNVLVVKDPCSINPYRKAWSLRQCGIITSKVFQPCHAQVDPGKYFESCISDSCACDSGGDCECFCTAVALYAQACSENGVCIKWRTPTICPMFCDYYNDVGECEWHYKPCGDKCMRTCRNPQGKCRHELSGCEGCYPKCPASRPYLNEDTMKCVAQCSCSDSDGNLFNYGEKVPSKQNCRSCECSMKGIRCQYDVTECRCEYEGKLYNYMEVIQSSMNGHAECKQMKCDVNGTFINITNMCTTAIPSLPVEQHSTQKITTVTTDTDSRKTTFTTTITSATSTPYLSSTIPNRTVNPSTTTSTKVILDTSTYRPTLRTTVSAETLTSSDLTATSSIPTTTSAITTTENLCYKCHWTQWIDLNHPTSKESGGDQESFETAEAKGIKVCRDKQSIHDIQCRATSYPNIPFENLGQNATCNVETGLHCRNNNNVGQFNMCYNYKVKYYCCYVTYDCPTTTTILSVSTSSITTPTTLTVSSTSPSPTSSNSVFTTSVSKGSSNSPTVPTVIGTSTLTTPITSATATPYLSSTIPNRTVNPSTTTSTKVIPDTPTYRPTLRTTVSAETLTSSDQTATSSIPTTTSAITTTENLCYKCHWTQWIDLNHPTSKESGGDQESFETAEAKGIKVCRDKQSIHDIQCRATSYPNIPFENLGQNATCNVETGLHCRNNNNVGQFNMCYNYKVKYYCCYVTYDCPTTTTILSVSTSSITTPTTLTVSSTSPSPTSSNSVFTTSVSKGSSNSPTVPTVIGTSTLTTPITSATATPYLSSTIPNRTVNPSTTTSTKVIPDTPTYRPTLRTTVSAETLTSSDQTATSSIPTTTSAITTTENLCYKCHWTQWIDLNHPTSKESGGDQESFETAEAKGIKVCRDKQSIHDIQCRATSYPNIPFENLGQNATCNVETGLHCRNNNNVGQFNMCYNYKVKYYCCYVTYDCPTTTTNLSVSTSSITTPTTLTVSSTSPSPTSSNSVFTTSVSKGSSNSPTVPTVIGMSTLTTPITSATATPYLSSTIPNRTVNPSTTTSTKVIPDTPTYRPTLRTTVSAETLTSSDQTATSSIPTTTSAITTTENLCYKCHWTQWIDLNHPTSKESGGDQESFETAEAKGIKVCRDKQSIHDIQCRATSYPNIPFENLGQNATCNVETGLHCRNNNNVGQFNMCYNYKVKYYCCYVTYDCPTTTTNLSVSTSSITTPTTLTVSSTSPSPTSSNSVFTTSVSKGSSNSPTVPTVIGMSTLTTPITSATATPYLSSTIPNRTVNPSTTTSTKVIPDTPTYRPTLRTTVSAETLTSSDQTATSSIPTTTSAITTTENLCYKCHWTQWIDLNHPTSKESGGDQESFETAEAKGIKVCRDKQSIHDIQCRATSYPNIPFENLGQNATCNVETGLHCRNNNNVGQFNMCYNYKVKYYCCYVTYDCPTTTTNLSVSTSSITTPTTLTVSSTSPSPTSSNSVFTTSVSKGSSNSPTVPTVIGMSTLTTPITSATATPYLSSTIPNRTVNPSTTTSTKVIPDTPTYRPTLRTTVSAETLTSSDQTATSSIPTTTSAITTTENLCYKCHWTQWIDLNHPTSKESGGDQESFETAEAKGIKVCRDKQSIHDIQCRATSYPNIPFENLGQNATCNVETGLHCRNNNNVGQFNMCYNYKVKYYCCYVTYDCPTTTTNLSVSTSSITTPTTLTVSSTSPSPTSSNSVFTTSVSKGSSNSPTVPTVIGMSTLTTPITSATATPYLSSTIPNRTVNPSTTTSTKVIPDTPTYRPTLRTTVSAETLTSSDQTATSSIPTTTSAITTTENLCYKCHWTQWIDLNHPTSKESGGDQESFETAEAKGIKVCRDKQSIHDIQCRATSYPNIPFENLGQNATCNVETGLHCRNNNNVGQFNMCYNYKVKYYCCYVTYDCPTTTTTILSVSTSSITTPTTLTVSSTSPSPISSNSVFTTSVSKGSSNSPTVPTVIGTSTLTTPITSATATPYLSSTIPNRTVNPSTTTSTKVIPDTPTYRPTLRTTVSAETLTSSDQTATSSIPTTTSAITTTENLCYKCHWTQWIDLNHPTSKKSGGDQESFETAEAKGIKVCRDKQSIHDIQCRATSYPNIPFENLGQNATCNVETGLHCRNNNNVGQFNMCYNYKVKYYCCYVTYDCPTTTTNLSVSTSSITTPTTLTVSSTSPSPTSSNSVFTTSVSKGSSNSPTVPTVIGMSTLTTPITSATATPYLSSTIPNRTVNPSTTTSTKVIPDTPTYRPTLRTTVSAETLTSSDQTATSSIPTTTSAITTTENLCYKCHWTQWIDLNHPTSKESGGDQESFETAEAKGIKVCRDKQSIHDIQCRATSYPNIPFENLGQNATCNVETGLHCRNNNNVGQFNMCYNYKVKYYCCYVTYDCPTTTTTILSVSTSSITTPTTLTVSSTSPSPISSNSVFTTSVSKGSSNSPTVPTVIGTSTLTTPITSATATPYLSSTIPNRTVNPSTTTSTKVIPDTPTYRPTLRTTVSAETLTSSDQTATSSIPTTTSAITTTENLCYKCHWTQWIDLNHPTSKKSGGDQESFETAEAKGIKVCRDKQSIHDIQCRATSYPNIPFENLGQNATCNVETGLHCRNNNNVGQFNMCYNYKVKYYCCYVTYDCPTTTTNLSVSTSSITTPTTLTVSSTSPSPTSSNSVFTTSVSKGSSNSPTVPTVIGMSTLTTPITSATATPYLSSTIPNRTVNPSTTTSTKVIPDTPTYRPTLRTTVSAETLTSSDQTATSSIPTTTSAITTTENLCYKCHWTQWIDLNHPTSKESGGDQESFETAEAKGIKVCRDKQSIHDIQCRATSYPNIPFENLGQNATCNVETGLHCRNNNNVGQFNMCYNYKVKYYCCYVTYDCPTTTTTILSVSTSSITTPTTLTVSSTSPSPTSSNSVFTTSVSKGSSNSPTVPTVIGTSTLTTPITSATATPYLSSTIPNRTVNPSTTTSTKVIPDTPTYRPTLRTTVSAETLTSSDQTATSSIPTTTSAITTTENLCYKCHWTQWIDLNHPTSKESGGDQESFETAEAKGIKVCRDKQSIHDIQCRATSYPNIPFENLGQNATCNVETGLHCRNNNNVGQFNMCYNYKVKYYCCYVTYDCPTTTTILSVSTSSITTPTTLTVSSTSPSPTSSNSVFTTSVSKGSSNSPTVPTVIGTSTLTTPITSATATPYLSSTIPNRTVNHSTTTSTKVIPDTPTYRPTLRTTVSAETLTSSDQTATSSIPTTTSAITTTENLCYKCHWTQWIDLNHPTSKESGGDQESFETAEAKGIKVCRDKQSIHDIQCRATSYPNIPFENLGQNATCNVETGLHCRNNNNVGQFNMCYNYKVKYYCCYVTYDCPTTTTILSVSTSSIITPTTLTVYSTSPSPTSSNTVFTTSVSKGSSNSPTVPTVIGTSTLTTPITSATATPYLSSTIPNRTVNHSTTTSTKVIPDTPTYRPTLRTTVSAETLTSSDQTATSSIPTTTSAITTTENLCYKCHWTQWIDLNHPTSKESGGDQESFETAEEKGIKVCRDKQSIHDIQCRATSYPNIPFENLGQNATCNVETGLFCRNNNNVGPMNMCYNYEVQFYCCHDCYETVKTAKTTPGALPQLINTTTTFPTTLFSTITLPKSSSISKSTKTTKSSNSASTLLTHFTASSSSTVLSKYTATEQPYICLYNGSIYEVGSSVPPPPSSCQDCKCTKSMKNTAEITCKPVVCQTVCPLGYKYTKSHGQCCGKCVQYFCVLNNTVLIKPGNIWRPPGDNCTCYDCEPGTFMVIKKVMSCPAQKPLKCEKGIVVNFTSTDGCCTIQYCEPRKCDVMKSWKIIESGACTANVTLTNCGGYCSSVSRHPNFPKMEEHDCTCCQASKTTTKNIQLQCANGKRIGYTFTDVLQCACRGAACVFTE
ncbi:uncharacterized protein LOC142103722 [Mixophyes fleayi]|uniref:uncharacterized protein LOC142103722 n=1 Tax=Mixophyes fleayi TaxID=3061075 RepID=UPI003F4DBB7C